MRYDLKLFILPINKLNGTQYWWTFDERPLWHRKGKKGECWNGPFASQEDAKADSLKTLESLTKKVEFELLPMLTPPGQVFEERMRLRFYIPLDEFSERLLDHLDPGIPKIEHQALLKELEVDVDLTDLAICQEHDTWILNTKANTKGLLAKADGDQVMILTVLYAQYCRRAELKREELINMLEPRLSLGDLYAISSPAIFA